MAKVKTIVPIVGTINGINFYYRKGELIARRAGGGFNGKAIKKSPTMKRVREQNTEFANCSAVNREFKLALHPILGGYKDGTLHSRLMSLFLKIKTLDAVNARGERRVAEGLNTSFGIRLLKDFVFTPKRSVLLPAQLNFDWATFTLQATNFDMKWVKFPAQAHFMEVTLQLVRFDFESLEFTSELGIPLNLTKDFTDDSFSLTTAEPSGTGLLLAVVRVCFYQSVNGQSYLLSGDGMLGVQIVSVG